MTALMLLLGISSWAPPAEALTQSFTNNGDYTFWNSNWIGNREVWSPIYVNVGLAITRVDVQCTVWTNGNGNDASDVTVYVRHPDGTDQQLVWAGTYSGQSISTTFNDVFKFNGKLSTGQWNLRVRDEGNTGNNNAVGGYIDSWTLTIHYQEPSLTVSAPGSAGQILQGTFQVTASVVGAGIEHMQVDVDGAFVSEMALSGSNYVYSLNTALWPDGLHTIGVTAADWQGRSDSETVSVKFDNVRPSVGLTQTLNNAFVKGTKEFLVVGWNGESQMNVGISISGPDTNIITFMADLGGGYFGYEWDTTAFPDGDYRVSISTADSAGNPASDGPFTLTVDNTPPVLAILSPNSGIYASGAVTLDLTGSADANANFTQYKIDGGAWTPAVPAWAETYQIDTTALSDGAHRISARVVDKAGWSAEGYVDVIVNNANPVLALVSPSDGDLLQGMITLRARAAAFLPISEVVLTLDGVARPAGFSSASGYYELPVDTALYVDGQHLLSASAKDASGKSVAAAGISFSADNHAPNLGVESPAEGQLAAGEIPLVVKASDAFLDEVGWWLDERPYAPLELVDTNWTGNLSTIGLPEGPHTLSFRARDTIGHAASAKVAIIVDNSAPGIQLIRPAGGEYLQGKAVFQIRADDERGLSSVVLHLSAEQSGRTLALNTLTGYYEFELDTFALADGNYTYWAEASDLTGKNVQAAPASFHIDNTPPVLALSYPENGMRLVGDLSRTVSATATDAFLAKVEYSLDGGAWLPLSEPFTGPGLADGMHAITVRAYDIPGHLTELSTGFTFDGNGPVVFIVSPVVGLRLAGHFKVAASASDAMGIRSVMIAPENSTGAPAKPMAFNPSTGLYEAEFDTAQWMGGDRPVSLTVTAFDTSGTYTSTSLVVYTDNSAPVITKVLPADTTEGTLEFRFKVADSSDLKSVLFRRDAGEWTELIHNEAGNYYYAIWKTGLAENGQHVYEVKAVDALGNERVTSFTVRIDNKDYGWVVWAVVVVLLVVLVLVLVIGRWRKRRAQEKAESALPEQPAPPPAPAGSFPGRPPSGAPDKDEVEFRADREPFPPSSPPPPPPGAPPAPFPGEGPGQDRRMPPMPPPGQSPPPPPAKAPPSELEKLVEDLGK